MIPFENHPRRRAAILAVFFFFPMFMAGPGVPEADPSRLSRAERAELARKVKGIFKEKCARCHTANGADREEYKEDADIDFILDLERMASNEDIIARGDPRASALFLQIDDNSMPFSDKGEDPLPMEEKRAIERWIKAGAPNEKGVVSTVVQ